MTLAVSPNHLTILLNEAQLGYLSYLYPGEDPEEALVKLLEGDRLRALRRAERKVEVLHLGDEVDGKTPAPVPPPEQLVPTEAENPIGTLQEYCQSKALLMPTYEFEDVTEGFCCTVWVSGLTASAIANAKKKAKTEAAAALVGALAGAQVYRV